MNSGNTIWQVSAAAAPTEPFGAPATPIHVPSDADGATLELARRALEEALNAATARAYELADGRAGDKSGG